MISFADINSMIIITDCVADVTTEPLDQQRNECDGTVMTSLSDG
jgi:hypothetical protein